MKNVKKVNVWKLGHKSFIFITPQKGKAEEVKDNLQEIADTVKAMEEYEEVFKNTGVSFVAVEEEGCIVDFKEGRLVNN
ncbi:hypothetical protein ACLM5H_24580 [Fredinandcohnia humi]